MYNFDAMRQQTLDRQRELLTEAARQRLLSTDTGVRDGGHAPTRPVRVALAEWMRHLADRLEPAADRSEARSAIR
ncbi:MAG TPA: hypothetical protein VJT14_14430 [Candidatus Dormibacteraeota bacterium]|nr:hypothetical protein [Candidatus Dormibacteraeota bacterium]